MPVVGNPAPVNSDTELPQIHVGVCCLSSKLRYLRLSGKRAIFLTNGDDDDGKSVAVSIVDKEKEDEEGSAYAPLTDKKLDWNCYGPEHNKSTTAASEGEEVNDPVFTCRCICCLFYKMGGFPEVIVRKILTQITDQQSILNSRLISPIWNQLVENSPEHMKRITFPIWDVEQFLNLSIVMKGKVKSVSFKDTSLMKSEHAERFLDIINNTVEKVTFAFSVMESFPKQSELFKLIMEKCTNLEEVIVNEYSNKYCLADQPAVFRGFINPDNKNIIGSWDKIKIVTVETHRLTHPEGLIGFLVRLPKLQVIRLNGKYPRSGDCGTIYSGLCKYIKKYEGQLHLKELSLNNGQFMVKHADHTALTSLLLLCAQHQIHLEGIPIIGFNSMLRLTESSELPSLDQRPFFPIKVNGKVVFQGATALRNLDRFDSLNVQHLYLLFERELMEGELSWIRNIQGLQILDLRVDSSDILQLSLPSVEEFQQGLTAGLPTLRKLRIYSDIFSSIHIFRWAEYFPNLMILEITDWQNVSNVNLLISELSVLDYLSILRLKNLPLKDIAFTGNCLNGLPNRNWKYDSSFALAPAIACIRSLKVLELRCCPLLTDACVQNGISKSRRLEKLVIYRCKNMTEDCQHFVTSEMEFLEY